MRNTAAFRYFVYSMEILLIFVLLGTPLLLPDIFGGAPCVLMASATTIAVFESEVPAMVFGMVCGVLIDLGFSNSIGTFAISLTIVCFILGFVANNYITANFWNVMLSSIVIITAVMSIHFLFSYVIEGYGEASLYFINHYISRIVLTVLTTAAIYFFNRFIYRTLSDEF